MELWDKIEDWSYYISDLDTPPADFEHHSTIVSLWNQKRVGSDLPAWSDFSLEDFEGWWGWLSVIDCLSPDGCDWKYRLWGTNFARFTGHEMTGKSMTSKRSDELGVQHYNNHDFDHIKVIFDQRKIGYLEGPVDSDMRDLTWVTLIRLPLADDGTNIDKFLNAVSPRHVQDY
jgi:hypothetical protein